MQLPTTGAPSRRQLRLTLIAWCLAALAVLSAPQAEAAKRLALVIGNDAYEEVEPLERAVADARSYRDALQEQRGFQVFYGENTGRRDMNRLVVDFLSAIGPGDTAMVVYSGHGVQLDPERRDSLYFLPVDFPNRDPGRGAESYFFDSEALNFARLAENVTARGARLRIFVLDACRNNPFNRDGGTRSIGLSRGLGRIQSSRGEFVFYAAAPGEVAFDRLPGDGPESGNSVFTRSFIKHFREGAYLEDVANDVQAEVVALARAANVQQEPYYSDGVAGRTCLEKECGHQAVAADAETEAEREALFWGYCETKDEPAYCEAYLAAFGDSWRSPLARARLAELSAATGAPTGPQHEGASVTERVPDDNATRDTTEAGLAKTGGAGAPDGTSDATTRTDEDADAEVAALDPDTSPPDVRSEFRPTRQQLRDIQTRLTILGLKPGPIDGLMGGRTRAALKAFQANSDLPADGILTGKVVELLAVAVPEARLRDFHAARAREAAERRAAAAPAARERALRERAAGARETASEMTSGDYTSHDGADAASPATTEDTIRTPAGTSVTTSSGSSLRTGRRESEDGEAPDWICRANPELNRCRHAF